MTKTHFRRIAFAVLIMIVLLPIQLRAQDDVNSYKVGERIEYKDNHKYDSATRSYPVVWLEGTVVRLSPPRQVIIRWDPRADYESYTRNGVSIYEAAYNIAEMRHIKARNADKLEDKGGANATVNPPNNAKTDKTDEAKTADIQGGTGLMTREEILGYMKTNGYVNGVVKYDQQVCRDLIEQIKRRGAKEPFKYGDDLSPIYKNGCGSIDSDVDAAVKSNLGPPNTVKWLNGTWNMNVLGGILVTAPGDGYIHTKGAVVGTLGYLTINANGTYLWKPGPSDPLITGTWRNATKAEMQLKGGAGIVLLKGEAGYDWLAFKKLDPDQAHKEDRIEVEGLLNGGSYRRYGSRK